MQLRVLAERRRPQLGVRIRRRRRRLRPAPPRFRERALGECVVGGRPRLQRSAAVRRNCTRGRGGSARCSARAAVRGATLDAAGERRRGAHGDGSRMLSDRQRGCAQRSSPALAIGLVGDGAVLEMSTEAVDEQEERDGRAGGARHAPSRRSLPRAARAVALVPPPSRCRTPTSTRLSRTATRPARRGRRPASATAIRLYAVSCALVQSHRDAAETPQEPRIRVAATLAARLLGARVRRARRRLHRAAARRRHAAPPAAPSRSAAEEAAPRAAAAAHRLGAVGRRGRAVQAGSAGAAAAARAGQRCRRRRRRAAAAAGGVAGGDRPRGAQPPPPREPAGDAAAAAAALRQPPPTATSRAARTRRASRRRRPSSAAAADAASAAPTPPPPTHRRRRARGAVAAQLRRGGGAARRSRRWRRRRRRFLVALEASDPPALQLVKLVWPSAKVLRRSARRPGGGRVVPRARCASGDVSRGSVLEPRARHRGRRRPSSCCAAAACASLARVA